MVPTNTSVQNKTIPHRAENTVKEIKNVSSAFYFPIGKMLLKLWSLDGSISPPQVNLPSLFILHAFSSNVCLFFLINKTEDTWDFITRVKK